MSGEARKIRLIMDLRRAGIVDTRVLSAIERLPREAFIPPTFADQAYENTALPIGQGQTISQPLVVATMTQALEVGERMRVLEIGTGSGYQAAVLARLCRRVYTIERHKPLLAEAEARFRRLSVHNVTAILGDGGRGWPEQAPFDRILVTACAPDVPKSLLDQLAEDGIMVLPVGPAAGEQVLLKVRRKDGRFTSERLMQVRFVPLVGASAGGAGEKVEAGAERR